MFTPFAFVKEEIIVPTGFRYWRYQVNSTVVTHHPRVSRIDLLDSNNNNYNMITYVSDNCSDLGDIPGGASPSLPANIDKDFGEGNLVDAVNAQFYNTFGGGQRASGIIVYYSTDGVSYTTAFSGVADSDDRPTTPRCGLHTIL
jgi:hypothetical protein